jgi:hypothetical protein
MHVDPREPTKLQRSADGTIGVILLVPKYQQRV